MCGTKNPETQAKISRLRTLPLKFRFTTTDLTAALSSVHRSAADSPISSQPMRYVDCDMNRR